MKQIVLGTKLKEAEAAAFQAWCKSHGRTSSEIIHYMIQCVLRMQGKQILDNEMLQSVFHFWDGFKDIDRVCNILAPGAKLTVVECVYMLSRTGHGGITPVLVEPSVFDEPVYSTDKNEIFDEVLNALCPTLNKMLKHIGARMECSGMIETLTELCNYYERNNDEDKEFIRELFSDNNRSEYGIAYDSVIKYVRHNKKSVNTQLDLFPEPQEPQEPNSNE